MSTLLMNTTLKTFFLHTLLTTTLQRIGSFVPLRYKPLID